MIVLKEIGGKLTPTREKGDRGGEESLTITTSSVRVPPFTTSVGITCAYLMSRFIGEDRTEKKKNLMPNDVVYGVFFPEEKRRDT